MKNWLIPGAVHVCSRSDHVKKITIILLVVVVLVIGAGALAMSSGSDDGDEQQPPADSGTNLPPEAGGEDANANTVRANWREDVGHTLTSSDGLSTTADEEKKFVVLTYTLTNNTDTPIELNMLIFEWKILASGVSYSPLLGTSAAYLDYSNSTVYKGGTATQYLAYEIPEDAVLEDVIVSYLGDFDPTTIIRDSSIIVDAPTELF